jgi:hypothetical protein
MKTKSKKQLTFKQAAANPRSTYPGESFVPGEKSKGRNRIGPVGRKAKPCKRSTRVKGPADFGVSSTPPVFKRYRVGRRLAQELKKVASLFTDDTGVNLPFWRALTPAPKPEKEYRAFFAA